MSFSISGKTAIVTGGAQGIGLAIAQSFADKGANVMVADMDEKQLRKEFGDLDEASNIRYFAGDLRQKLTLANLLSATIAAFEQVDILVNASRQVSASDPLSADDDAVEEMMQQNLMPALRLSQMVAKRMIKQAEDQDIKCAGSIINLSSIVTRHANPHLMGFSISVAALEQMTRSLAMALADERIRVNALAIGSVMSASLMNVLKDNAEFRSEIETCTPLGRIAPASELVETAQYLASDASSFVTGQVLTVDGGRTLLDPVRAPVH